MRFLIDGTTVTLEQWRIPCYQFIIPAGGPSAQHKAELVAAFTKVHTDVTGAPAHYVNCSFVEVPPGSLFVADRPVEHGRMVGIIRPAGRRPSSAS